MSLSPVKIGEEVWLTCLSHALTTETEEIMGLLGHIEHSSKGATALIWGASPQMRCERKKDRVEVNPELLAAASGQAEIMTTIIKRKRVIGWYHSHPHITVLPSHVAIGVSNKGYAAAGKEPVFSESSPVISKPMLVSAHKMRPCGRRPR